MKRANNNTTTKDWALRAPVDAPRLHRVLCRVVRGVGEALLVAPSGASESQSILGNHIASRWDVNSLGLFTERSLLEFAREGMSAPSLETEEAVLLPPTEAISVRLVIDPIDGTKAWDNFKAAHDLPIPNPSSAVSVAALCPVTGVILASAVYAFDLQEVYSAWALSAGLSRCIAFRNDVVIAPVGQIPSPPITAKKRILHANYAAAELSRLAEIDLALVRAGLAPFYGGLAGSSAVDVINVIRGSFCGYVDVRALLGVSGAQLKFYDVAGVILPAVARGLSVRLMDALGQPLDLHRVSHDAPVGLIVARPEDIDRILGALSSSVLPSLPAIVSDSSETARGATLQ